MNVKRAIILGAIAIAGLVGAAKSNAPAALDETAVLPADPAREGVVNNCQSCHSVSLVTQQRLNEKQWMGELVKMQKWGSALAESDFPRVAAYLAKHYNPTVPEARAPLVKSPKTPG